MLCGVATRLEFYPQEGDVAGIVVYMNETHHYIFGLTNIGGDHVIILRRQVGSLIVDRHSPPINGAVVDLRIEAKPDKYTFTYHSAEQAWHILGEAETQFVSTDVAGGFTGVFFGIHNYSLTGTTAYFDWFEYRTGESRGLKVSSKYLKKR